jgi:hypothetical protein
MNKRSLAVFGSVVVLTLACFSLLAGCRHKTHIVRLIVHGSVVIKLDKSKTVILAPAVDPGDLQHFLAAGYPSIGEATSTPCGAGAYEFTLKGTKAAEKRAGGNEETDRVIDPAFDLITFTRPNWQPLGQPYFVTMDLPPASRIVAFGGRHQIQFHGSSEPDFVPLTQILEFEARDSDDVRLVRTCGSDKREYEGLNCKDMRARYDKAFKETPSKGTPRKPDRDDIDFALKSCADDASYLFVGIGLHPNDLASAPVHGVNFFNSKILPEIFGGKNNVPEDKKLVEKGHLTPNGGGDTDHGDLRLIKASFDGAYPRYMPVLMIENCTSPSGFVRP